MSGGLGLVAASIAAAVTAVGVYAARHRDAQVRRLAPVAVAFAAGVLVTAALAHLLPHALGESPRAPLWALGGFVAMAVLARFATGRVCEEGDGEPRRVAGWPALFGIGLHSFLDGSTYSVAFSAGSVSGATAALGMISHELPEGLIAYALLVRDGMAPRRAAQVAWLVAGLTTPVGALVAVPVLDVLHGGLRAVLVAIAGGVLLHVGAAHLLPQVERERTRWGVWAFGVGVAIALAGTLVRGA